MAYRTQFPRQVDDVILVYLLKTQHEMSVKALGTARIKHSERSCDERKIVVWVVDWDGGPTLACTHKDGNLTCK
jgi:hypothetical protein